MRAACITSINQHFFEGEKGMLIKQSKKYFKFSKTLAEIVGGALQVSEQANADLLHVSMQNYSIKIH